MRLTYYIRHIGRRHHSFGIEFTLGIWRELKNSLLEQVETCRDPEKLGHLQNFTPTSMSVPSIKIKSAWKKLIDFVLREMKQGCFMFRISGQPPRTESNAYDYFSAM